MVLRYFDTDYCTYKENELLFMGTEQECITYLVKNWSVDLNEIGNNLELRATFCDYLKHIQFSYMDHGLIKSLEELPKEIPNWSDAYHWFNINASLLILNKEIVS